VSDSDTRSLWRQWLQRPQRVWLRRAVFQIHLWCGIGIGLYVLFISVTGSVLVYRNELYVAATPEDGVVRGDDGEVVLGVRLVSGLIDLHDNFLAGDIGQVINGVLAFAVLLIAATGAIIWWPGVRRWRNSMTLRRGIGWKRFNWDLHSAAGFWGFAVIVLFAVSGAYLCFPESFHAFADRLQPATVENEGMRLVDDVLYWLAFLHFGRINGIGLPCSGPGLCDQTIKAIWAVGGLLPALMFVTGAMMWWNRVVKRWIRKYSQ
jgi:uncharacterized iron-regulated membrane protein